MTIDELKEMQGWTLEQKIYHTIEVIQTFVTRRGGVNSVYVSVSFGKDSLVLWDICKRIYPDILGIFINTRMEYPSVCRLAHEMIADGENIKILYPKMKPKDIWAKFGFPLVSKETSNKIYYLRMNPDNSQKERFLARHGWYNIPLMWRFLLDAKYCSSAACCRKLKKEPAHSYERRTGRSPILGILASESRLRTHEYITQGGCNVFDGRALSKPLSIWTENDVWEYIKRYNLRYPDIYDEGLRSTGCMACGFGAHMNGDEKLGILYKTYPKWYDMIMSFENNGITFREALREVLSKKRKYLPDEKPSDLFGE